MTRILAPLLFLVTTLSCSGSLDLKSPWRELSNLDTGEWEIQSAQSRDVDSRGIPVYLFAVRGEERRRLHHVSEVAKLILTIREEREVREFYRLISMRGRCYLALEGCPGRMLSAEEWAGIPDDADISVIPRLARHEDGFMIQRVVAETGGDTPALIREYLRPGSYRWERIRSLERSK